MSESKTITAICYYLQIMENRGDLYFFRNNSFRGKILREDNTAGWINNNKKGTPDIIICYEGYFIAFEIKSKKGTQTLDQKVTEFKIKKTGGFYYIIKNVEDIQNILKALSEVKKASIK